MGDIFKCQRGKISGFFKNQSLIIKKIMFKYSNQDQLSGFYWRFTGCSKILKETGIITFLHYGICSRIVLFALALWYLLLHYDICSRTMVFALWNISKFQKHSKYPLGVLIIHQILIFHQPVPLTNQFSTIL